MGLDTSGTVCGVVDKNRRGEGVRKEEGEVAVRV